MDTPALMWRPGAKIKGCGSALIKHLLADLINSSKHFTFSGVIATEISNLTLLNNHFDFGSILKVKLETVSNKQLILVFMISDVALFRVHFTETQIAFQYYDGANWTYIWQK